MQSVADVLLILICFTSSDGLYYCGINNGTLLLSVAIHHILKVTIQFSRSFRVQVLLKVIYPVARFADVVLYSHSVSLAGIGALVTK